MENDRFNEKGKTVTEAMEEWMKETKLGKSTARSYDREESTFCTMIKKYPIGKMQVTAITSKEINDHIHRLLYEETPLRKTEKGYSYSSVKKVYQLLGQFFRYLYGKNIGNNPMNNMQMPEPEENADKMNENEDNDPLDLDLILNDAQIEKFKKACFEEPVPGVSGSKYGKAVFFMLLTMLREGEALGLRWGDIDTDNRIMSITKNLQRIRNREDGGKSRTKVITAASLGIGRSNRKVFLTNEAVKTILLYKAECRSTGPSDLVFATSTGSPLSTVFLYKTVRGLLSLGEIDKDKGGKKFGPRCLRATGICYYMRHGVPDAVLIEEAGLKNESVDMLKFYKAKELNHEYDNWENKLLSIQDKLRRDNQS